MRRPGLLFVAGVASFSALPLACFSAGDGTAPPTDRAYFPVGLALTANGRHLAVVNSDFDLQFNAGTLTVLDLERVREFVPLPCLADADCAAGRRCDVEPSAENSGVPGHVCVDESGPDAGRPCGPVAERGRADQLLYPGRCDAVSLVDPPGGESLLVDGVQVGAFATDLVYRERPISVPDGARGRLFFPVRGDATLHWADIDDEGRIECGQGRNHGACDDVHRAGDDPDQENTRDLRLDPEPFAVDVSPDGDAVLVTNQTSGRVALFINDWSARGPRLEFVVGDLPSRPVGVAALPPPALARVGALGYPPGFLITFRNAPELRLIRYYSDDVASPERPFASSASRVGIFINSLSTDSRGITIDGSTRAAAELACAEDSGIDAACRTDAACIATLPADTQTTYLSCLSAVTPTPLDVFVANRTPPSLLVGRTTPALNSIQSSELPAFFDTIPLALGPSRVVAGDVVVGTGADGNLVYERRVFVVCFDSKRIFIYDPDRRRVDAEIATGRGPHALALDSARGLLYVGHFTDSFLGVVSVDRRFPATYGRMLATIGQPSPPRASK